MAAGIIGAVPDLPRANKVKRVYDLRTARLSRASDETDTTSQVSKLNGLVQRRKIEGVDRCISIVQEGIGLILSIAPHNQTPDAASPSGHLNCDSAERSSTISPFS
jgi:hypothetical protein